MKMVDTIEEKKELETLKQLNKIELITLNQAVAREEHRQKMERLDKLLAIAKAGGATQNI